MVGALVAAAISGFADTYSAAVSAVSLTGDGRLKAPPSAALYDILSSLLMFLTAWVRAVVG